MILKEFKMFHPKLFKDYEESHYSKRMDLKPVDRIIGFIESKGEISFSFIPLLERNVYCPSLVIKRQERKTYNIWKGLNQTKLFALGKALEYLKTGLLE